MSTMRGDPKPMMSGEPLASTFAALALGMPVERAAGEETTTSDASGSSVAAKKSADDFIFGRVIGEGSFSMVCLSREKNTKKDYAIKICEKSLIKKEKKQGAIMREKEIMNILNEHPCPFFIKLMCTFQDANRLYFVMNYASNGELLPYINKVGSFDEECTRFYGGEVLLALEHLHRLGIIHRDLKPENLLLNEQMHIQVTDFGSALVLESAETSLTLNPSSLQSSEGVQQQPKRRNSFVGTAQYVSPEMLTDKRATPSSDLWALGCILYQMTAGLPPFRAPNEYLIFQKIMKLDYEFPDGFSKNTKQLIEKLLQIEATQRLGATDVVRATGYQSLRSNSFFRPLEERWSSLHMEVPPRILPYLPGTSANEELRSQYLVPDHLESGLDERQMTRLLGLALYDEEMKKTAKGILDISDNELIYRLEKQAKENPYHRFVENNLILRQGFVDKRKGLFARRRMLLLTTGPHLYYVDAVNQVLKGQIPWSLQMRPEPKNFKTFFVHTPNRTYYLEDPEGDAPGWCKRIDEVRLATYCGSNSSSRGLNSSSN